MGLLPNYKEGFAFNYLSPDLVEFIRTTVLAHSYQFILKDRRTRLKWIKADVGFLLPFQWKKGVIKSFLFWFSDAIIFGLFREKLIATLDNYRKHGKLAFSKEKEAILEAALKKRNNGIIIRWANKYIKWRLKNIHNQEEVRRKYSFFEHPIPYIENPVSVEDAVFLDYQALQHLSFFEFLYLSNWEHLQMEIIIERIDRTFQRFIICAKNKKEEVVNRLNIKMDELSKDIDAIEKVEQSIQESKFNEIVRFQTKIELEFYNYLFKNVDNLIVPQTKSSKNKDTMKQQSLMIYYLLAYAKLFTTKVDNSTYADFIKFLTGKSWDNIRKNWNNTILKLDDDSRKKDLSVIRKYFEDIEAFEIVKMIDNDINFRRLS